MRDLLQFAPSAENWLRAADAIVKATLVLGAAAVVSYALRRASAAVRHMVWTIALLCALVVPVLAVALPRWQLPIVTLQSSAPAVVAPAPVAETTPAVEPLNPPRILRAPGTKTAAAPVEPARPVFTMPAWPVLALALWAAGAAAILARLFAGVAAVWLMTRRTSRVAGAPWLPLARELASELGIGRRVVYMRSPNATMPMACGVFAPAVLMPADADAWPADRLRVVLLHELAHVKRRDCLTHAVAQIVCAVYWFNPLVWIAARRLRAERELACDDLVLAAGTRGSDYANQLLEIARVMRAGRFPGVLAGATLAMAHRSQLEGRLMAILDTTTPRTAAGRIRTAAVATLFAGALMPLASLQPWTSVASAATAATIQEQTHHTTVTPPQPHPVTVDRHDRDAVVRGHVTTGVVGGVHDGIADGVSAGVAHGVAEGVRHGVATSVHGAIAGAVGGVAQGVTQAIAESVTHSVEMALQNVNPNPNPRPVKIADDRRERKPADPKVIAALREALKDSDKEVRETALHALVQLRDPGIFEPLVEALKDGSPDVREQAATGLAQLRDKRALAPLAAALKDQHPGVREQAAFGIGQMRDPSVVPDLIAALHDTNADVREQVVFALGQIRDKRAVEGLISALKDTSADVKEQAAFALGQIRDPGSVDALIVALKDQHAKVREQAAFALGQIRDSRALDALTAALKDTVADVRQQAAFAIGQIAR
jgi:HEAT repeat protein/beta-lactamase regulating signal transducer with metallopeptidase domain